MVDRSEQSEKQESTLSGQDEFATRRTVIQGLASVAPVIMTLSSGEALANSSSLQCIKKPLDTPPKCIGKKESDKWLRKYTKVSKDCSSKKIWGSKKTCDSTKTTKKCLVYVDESGKFTTKKDGYPITRSCYNSFLPKK